MKPLEGHLDQAAPRGASVAVFSVGTWKTLTLSGQVLIRIDQAGTRGPKGLPLPVSSCPIRPSAMLAALPKRLVCHVPPSTPMLWWAVPAVRTVTHRDQRRPAAHRLLRHLEGRVRLQGPHSPAGPFGTGFLLLTLKFKWTDSQTLLGTRLTTSNAGWERRRRNRAHWCIS